MHVLHILGFACGQIVVGYVHAAGKGHTVAHQHFAVVAQIDAEIGRKQARRHELGHLNAAFCKLFPRLAQRVEHAYAVYQQAHVHTALRSACHGLAKSRGHLTRIEYVGAKKNMIPGLVDGRYHGRVGLIAVAQKAYAVAAAQVLFGKHTANVLHAGNAVRDIFWRNFRKRWMRVVRFQRLLPPHDTTGPAFGPAYAKTGIQQGPQNRQKKRSYCPAQGCARVVLGEQGMAHSNPRQYVGNQQPNSFKKKQHVCPKVSARHRKVRTVTGVAAPLVAPEPVLCHPEAALIYPGSP